MPAPKITSRSANLRKHSYAPELTRDYVTLGLVSFMPSPPMAISPFRSAASATDLNGFSLVSEAYTELNSAIGDTFIAQQRTIIHTRDVLTRLGQVSSLNTNVDLVSNCVVYTSV